MMSGLGLNHTGPHNQGLYLNQLCTNPNSKTSTDLKGYFFFQSDKYEYTPGRCKIISGKTTANLRKQSLEDIFYYLWWGGIKLSQLVIVYKKQNTI